MGRNRSHRLTTKRPGSPNWYCNFTVHGHRFRGCLETEDGKLAETLAAKIKSDALLGIVREEKPQMTLDAAAARYWIEHASSLPSAPDIRRQARTLLKLIGKTTPVSMITGNKVGELIARRRGDGVSNATINRELTLLRAILYRARDAWEIEIGKVPWGKLWLTEADEREVSLSDDQEQALTAALRPDFHPLVRFAIETGIRVSNARELTWQQVDWNRMLIVFRVKSKKPGGRVHVVPITQSVAAILSVERDHHPEFVFTYVCARNRHDPHHGLTQHKGERYPFTRDGWRKEWLAALSASGLPGLRFHDLRHTFAARLLSASGNIKVVQKALGHADIATTLRYLKAGVDDVREAMEKVSTQGRHNEVPKVKKAVANE